MEVNDLEQLLRGAAPDADGLSEAEELQRRALDGLSEGRVVRGGGGGGGSAQREVVEDVEAEAALAGEDAPDGGAGRADPAADLSLEGVPLEPLNVADTKLLDAEPAQGGVDGRLADGGVHLDALAAVPGGGHAGGDGLEVGDCVHGEEVDLADALQGAVAAAPADGGRRGGGVVIVAPRGRRLGGVGVPRVAAGYGERAEARERLDLEVERARRQHVAELVLEPRHGDLKGGAARGADGGRRRQAAEVVHRPEEPLRLGAVGGAVEQHLVVPAG